MFLFCKAYSGNSCVRSWQGPFSKHCSESKVALEKLKIVTDLPCLGYEVLGAMVRCWKARKLSGQSPSTVPVLQDL